MVKTISISISEKLLKSLDTKCGDLIPRSAMIGKLLSASLNKGDNK